MFINCTIKAVKSTIMQQIYMIRKTLLAARQAFILWAAILLSFIAVFFPMIWSVSGATPTTHSAGLDGHLIWHSILVHTHKKNNTKTDNEKINLNAFWERCSHCPRFYRIACWLSREYEVWCPADSPVLPILPLSPGAQEDFMLPVIGWKGCGIQIPYCKPTYHRCSMDCEFGYTWASEGPKCSLPIKLTSLLHLLHCSAVAGLLENPQWSTDYLWKTTSFPFCNSSKGRWVWMVKRGQHETHEHWDGISHPLP